MHYHEHQSNILQSQYPSHLVQFITTAQNETMPKVWKGPQNKSLLQQSNTIYNHLILCTLSLSFFHHVLIWYRYFIAILGLLWVLKLLTFRSLLGGWMVRAPGRVTSIPVVRVRNPSRANADKNALCHGSWCSAWHLQLVWQIEIFYRPIL